MRSRACSAGLMPLRRRPPAQSIRARRRGEFRPPGRRRPALLHPAPRQPRRNRKGVRHKRPRLPLPSLWNRCLKADRSRPQALSITSYLSRRPEARSRLWISPQSPAQRVNSGAKKLTRKIGTAFSSGAHSQRREGRAPLEVPPFTLPRG